MRAKAASDVDTSQLHGQSTPSRLREPELAHVQAGSTHSGHALLQSQQTSAASRRSYILASRARATAPEERLDVFWCVDFARRMATSQPVHRIRRQPWKLFDGLPNHVSSIWVLKSGVTHLERVRRPKTGKRGNR